ncbi:MAG TPA: 4a-hydroxytetrahydrobiopterin dehydratase [Deltaproteobacteria bacterium]|nr:4a-hydroxytetrahydrobiopterin dehydratase [Deltaproteobacteria bacterium]HCP44640.1 4a-hydroxytetrahydrobiopterin dehydratase [Deltaproteobacteria bacterium]
MTEDLASRKCIPCEGGVDALSEEAATDLLGKVPGWTLVNGDKLHRTLLFPDFVRLMSFVNEMAELAEAEGHHPDFSVHYNRLEVTVWTHAIEGLSENDFILAAKISRIRDA